MSKKHTNTCYDCIHLATCYKIEHYGRDLETNIPCKEFIGVNDRVEVVRCKDCQYAHYWYGNDTLGNAKYLCHYIEYDNFYPDVFADDFCSRGEKRD